MYLTIGNQLFSQNSCTNGCINTNEDSAEAVLSDYTDRLTAIALDVASVVDSAFANFIIGTITGNVNQVAAAIGSALTLDSVWSYTDQIYSAEDKYWKGVGDNISNLNSCVNGCD